MWALEVCTLFASSRLAGTQDPEGGLELMLLRGFVCVPRVFLLKAGARKELRSLGVVGTPSSWL